MYGKIRFFRPPRGDVHVPDYDYRKDTCFGLYHLTDGGCASCFVTDEKGGERIQAKAGRQGKQIRLELDGWVPLLSSCMARKRYRVLQGEQR